MNRFACAMRKRSPTPGSARISAGIRRTGGQTATARSRRSSSTSCGSEFKSTKTHVINNLDRFVDLFESMATLSRNDTCHRATRLRPGRHRDRSPDLRATRRHPDRQIEVDGHRGNRAEPCAGRIRYRGRRNRRRGMDRAAGPRATEPHRRSGPAYGSAGSRRAPQPGGRPPVSLEDIPEQVQAIRDAVRPVFFTAGVGMNGANALIAETGTVMIVTNEGNGRLSGSIPPVHIVLAGIEKLVPTFDDAMTQLRLLGAQLDWPAIDRLHDFHDRPNAGPRDAHHPGRQRPPDDEVDARVRARRCTVFAAAPARTSARRMREVSGHVFGHIYSGAIGLVVSGFHHGLESIAKPQSLCLSCNACEMVCPVGYSVAAPDPRCAARWWSIPTVCRQ